MLYDKEDENYKDNDAKTIAYNEIGAVLELTGIYDVTTALYNPRGCYKL